MLIDNIIARLKIDPDIGIDPIEASTRDEAYLRIITPSNVLMIPANLDEVVGIVDFEAMCEFGFGFFFRCKRTMQKCFSCLLYTSDAADE